jgi:hypothetical protein
MRHVLQNQDPIWLSEDDSGRQHEDGPSPPLSGCTESSTIANGSAYNVAYAQGQACL